MSVSTPTAPLIRSDSGRAPGDFRPPALLKETPALEATARPWHTLELDTTSSHWQLALDSAQRALSAADRLLPGPELERRRRELAQERQETAKVLASLAKVAGVRPVPWLSPVPVTTQMLGLPAMTSACLFDLDGVLTDSAVLHAWAWGEVFDEFLLRLSEKTGWHFIPFDRQTDYSAYIDGRTRLEGIHAFLDSRGIRLREGRVDDPVTADSAEGLAKRKGEVLSRGLGQHGVAALAGARRYLEATGHAGLGRAVVSASTSTLPMLELANLATLVEERVDAEDIRSEGLRSRPAPDLWWLPAVAWASNRGGSHLHAQRRRCGRGHSAGLGVIGVGDREQRELLQGFGAEEVVPSLSVLLDHQLSGGANIPAELDRRGS